MKSSDDGLNAKDWTLNLLMSKAQVANEENEAANVA